MFGERLKALRKEKGVTQEQLAAFIGVERSSIGKYEGKSKIIPSDDVKLKIANFFGVTVDYLMGYSDRRRIVDMDALTSDENELVDMFRSLTPAGQRLALDYCRMILSNDDYRQDVPSALER